MLKILATWVWILCLEYLHRQARLEPIGRLVLNYVTTKYFFEMGNVCVLTRHASALALLCTRSTLMEIPKHRVPRSAFEALNACFSHTSHHKNKTITRRLMNVKGSGCFCLLISVASISTMACTNIY